MVVSVIYCDWSALHETWTAKILYTVHVHWRWIEESKSLIWPNNLNQHLVAWFYVTFESSNVTSHFSALRPTYSWLPWGTYSCTEIIQTGGWDQIHHLFCDSWNTQNCCLWTRVETPTPPCPPPLPPPPSLLTAGIVFLLHSYPNKFLFS